MDILNNCETTCNKRFGLTGFPLGHSLSPAVHAQLALIDGVHSGYELFPIEADSFDKSVPALFEKLDGFNITIPYKTKIMRFCKKIDADAEYFGAVNCVDTASGTGYNTDVIGLRRSLDLLGTNLSGKVCLIGFGGAGRMIAGETLRQGGRLTICLRDSGKAADFADIASVITTARLSGDFDVVINATPAGMYPREGTLPDGLEERLPEVSAAAALDIVYNPAETEFLSRFKAKGSRILNGLPMLVWQAAMARQIWCGTEYSPEEVNGVIQNLSRKNIYLIGFMGCGKSFLGRKAAKALALPFSDNDIAIADAAGKSIPEIFAEYGETGFREREYDELVKIGHSPVCNIVALGGGAVTYEKSRNFIRENGIVIFIDTDFDACAARVSRDMSRPVAAGKTRDELYTLYHKRLGIYNSAAHFVVNNSNNCSNNFLDELKELIKGIK